MATIVEATYEAGVLKLDQPLPFAEQARVRIIVEPATNWAEATFGIVASPNDPKLIEQIAMDPDLEYSS